MSKLKDRLNEMFDYKNGALIRKVRTCNSVQIGDDAGYLRPDGRVIVMVDGKQYLRYRLIWIWHHGDIPSGMDIDHIDTAGLKSDDRIENLRVATRSQNVHNTESKGYCWHKGAGKWRAQICHQDKQIHLGLFDCQIDARAEYLRAKRHYAGEFAPR